MTEIAAIHRLTVGESHSVRKTISESDVYLYAGIVGDFHPNHVDAVYAAEHLGKRVAHGALLPGFVSRATVELIDPSGRCERSRHRGGHARRNRQ